MKKELEFSLSLSDIRKLKSKISELKENLPKCANNITKSLADYTYNEIQNNINSTSYKDGNEDIEAFKNISNNNATVGMKGSQVLYDEFGTGTQGEQSPHPLKGKFSLNKYNSGRRIRPAGKNNPHFPAGTKYWTYKNKNGDTVYTTGIPAGKQVYNASRALQKQKSKIINKELGDILSKL